MKQIKITKKKVWAIFSTYIRLKYANHGYVHCVTCGKGDHYKAMQAGHWIPGRHNAVLFDERNVHPQCYHCNIGLKGNPIVYYHFMERTYGKKVMKELEQKDKEIKQFKLYELEALYDIYKEKLKKEGVL
jgi:hypothetical protein